MVKESDNDRAYNMLKAIGFQRDVEIISTNQGAVNDIIVFARQDRKQVLRVRTGEKFFRYERGLVKEPLIAHFMYAAKPHDPEYNQAVLEQALEHTANGKSAPKVEGLPEIFRYGVKELGVPWTLQEYIEGSLISDSNQIKAWHHLGKQIGFLHGLNLSFAGRLNEDINQSPSEHLKAVLDEIKRLIPIQLNRCFNFESLSSMPMALCHNDLHCLNVKEGYLLDWDNTFIANPALDFAKLKLWISLDKEGRFSPREEYFKAFLSGYVEVNERLPEQEALDLYQLLFLCRVYTFEKQNEDSGNKMQPPFPGSAGYLPHIEKLAR
ncbi:MAG: phosphotransferase [Alphaproteobacteria bacterium]|nr:phosphotransferase [Alphaproteobacteria bacterium]